MIERAIAMLNEQQRGVKERSAPWMVAEQLKDICRREPESADLLASLGNSQAEKAWQGAIQLLYDMTTLTPPNEWVSVEERLPEYNPGTGAKSYWVAKKDNAGNWQMKIAQYCDYGYAMTMDVETEVTWRDWDFTKIANVTHWMPFPAPPTKEE